MNKSLDNHDLYLFHADLSETMSVDEKTWIKIEKTNTATPRLARSGRSFYSFNFPAHSAQLVFSPKLTGFHDEPFAFMAF